jgi:hypothetical protein
MVSNIRVKEFVNSGLIEEDINNWLEKNEKDIITLMDIKYHTQLTDSNAESSALIIYKAISPDYKKLRDTIDNG